MEPIDWDGGIKGFFIEILMTGKSWRVGECMWMDGMDGWKTSYKGR